MTEGQQMRIQFLILGFTGLKWYSRPWLSLVMLLVENYLKMDNVNWLVKENQNKQTNKQRRQQNQNFMKSENESISFGLIEWRPTEILF